MKLKKLDQSSKADLIILVVTLCLILPLSLVHGLFTVLGFLSAIYLMGSGLVHLYRFVSSQDNSPSANQS